jgi:general secretion pathway protein J
MKSYSPASGFTLLEIIISLFILVIVGVVINVGLGMMVKNSEHIAVNITAIRELQLGMTIMERDIQQMINRPILDETGQEVPAFVVSDGYLEFTHDGFINVMSKKPRSTLQRVAYILDDNQLTRITWDSLDRASVTKVESQILLHNVRSFQVHVIPETNTVTPSAVQKNNNNIAIKIEIDLLGVGYIKRIIPVAANTFSEELNASL